MQIGEQLRAEYGGIESALPQRLAALLERLEPATERPISQASSQLEPNCPRCAVTMVQVVHVQAFGGHPALGGHQCPKCRYIANRIVETARGN
jgi:hypothetical protein